MIALLYNALMEEIQLLEPLKICLLIFSSMSHPKPPDGEALMTQGIWRPLQSPPMRWHLKVCQAQVYVLSGTSELIWDSSVGPQLLVCKL